MNLRTAKRLAARAAILLMAGMAHADYLWLQPDNGRAKVLAGELDKPLARLPALADARPVLPEGRTLPLQATADHYTFEPQAMRPEDAPMGTTVLQRLRAAGLQPTVARIGLLQVLQAAAPACLSAEDLFQQMLQRGTRVSVGTIYRVVQQLHAAGLLVHEWDAQRRALHGVKPDRFDARTVRLVCRATGRTVTLADEELHAQLLAAAAHVGHDLRGQALILSVDSLVPVQGARPMRPPQQRPRLVA